MHESKKNRVQKPKKFTPKILNMYCVFGIITFLLFLSEGLDIKWKEYLTFLVVMSPVVLFLVFVQRFSIQDELLTGTDAFGFWHKVDLNSIDKVKPTRFFCLRYIKIYAPTLKRPIWLILDVRHVDEFIKVIEEKTPEHHPLRSFFASYSS